MLQITQTYAKMLTNNKKYHKYAKIHKHMSYISYISLYILCILYPVYPISYISYISYIFCISYILCTYTHIYTYSPNSVYTVGVLADSLRDWGFGCGPCVGLSPGHFCCYLQHFVTLALVSSRRNGRFFHLHQKNTMVLTHDYVIKQHYV